MPETHGVQTSSSSAASSAHSNVAPGRSELKVNVAVLSFVDAGGVPVRNVSGSATTVHSHSAGVGSTPPATFFARTSSSWFPAGTSWRWYGVSQEP